MPGTQIFTSFSTGKESTAGTSVPTTAEWYGDGTGELNIDKMLAMHRGNRGSRTTLAHATSMGEAVNITFNSDPEIGVAYNELHKLFGQLDGGNAGVQGTSDYVWTIAPSQTATNAPESYTIEIGDDQQYWEVAYCQARSFELSASPDSMTNVSVDWFGRAATKVTATSLAANTFVRIPGYLWIPRFAAAQADLAGSSALTGILKNFSVRYQTGLRPDRTMSGTTYFTQSVEALEQTAHLSFDLESGTTAEAEFDKFDAQTNTFFQLKATGPTLGNSAYGVTLQFSMLYTDCQPIASEDEGVNLYHFEADTSLDATWGTNMSAVVVNSLATIT